MYKLNLTKEQLVIIDRALTELPYRIVAPLFEEINKQIKEQEPKQD